MHGYGIRQIMNRIIGPYRTMAWGPLYTALRRLQASGLIEAAADDAHGDEADMRGGPPSKRYRLTEAGRARFHALMAVPREPEPEYEFLFGIKLARFGHAAPEERLALLRDYRAYCRGRLDHLVEASRRLGAIPHTAVNERPWILAAMDRWRAVWEADAAWVSRLIRVLEVGGGEPPPDFFPGIAEGGCARVVGEGGTSE